MSPRVRTILLASVYAALLAVALYSFFSLRLWDQQTWNETGRGRFQNVAFATALLAASLYPARSRLLAVILVCVVLLYTMAAVGAAPALATLYWLSGAWCLGRLLLRAMRLDRPNNTAPGWLLEAPLGLALVSFLMGVSASIPIHRPWLHWSWPGLCIASQLGSLPAMIRRLRTLEWRRPCSTGTYIVAAIVAFLIFAHWQAALMPELSADGLAMHLTIAAWMAAHGSFHFDVTRATWAVSPMAGDWLYASSYLAGGESAAKLVNLACLLLLAALAYFLAIRWTKPVFALLATALLLSTPVVYLVTGSLFVENSWTLFLLAAFLAVEWWRESRAARWLPVAGILAGSAVAAKFGAFFCLLALAVAGVLALKGAPRLSGGKLASLALFLLFASPPYAQAWLRTGNPLFPYFNHIFRSPLLDASEPFRDARWGPYLQPDLLYQVSFHTHRFLEAMDGTAGFQLFLLWPVALLALRRRLPFWIFVCALGAPLMLVMVFSGIAYLRYIYPAYMLVSVLLAWLLGEAEALNPWLNRSLVAGALLCVVGNTWLMGASTWYNKDFALNPLVDPTEPAKLREAGAPQRTIIEYFNKNAPSEPVAFIEDSVTAGFLGRAYTNSWHTLEFAYVLKRASSEFGLRWEFDQRGIRYVVAAVQGDSYRSGNPLVARLLARCGEPILRVGPLAALRLRDGCPEAAQQADAAGEEPSPQPPEMKDSGYPSSSPPPVGSRPLSPEEARAAAADDTDPRIRYFGSWHLDKQFQQAAQGTLTYSDQKGAAFEFVFYGTSITWVFTKAFNRGMARVLLDGHQIAVLDLYTPLVEWQQRASFSAAGPGPHRIRVEVLGQKNPASEGTFIDLDLLEPSAH